MINWKPEWGDIGDLGTHKGFVYSPIALADTRGLELGHVVSFSYHTKGDAGSKPRLAFVMHPNYEGKCHALTLKNIDRRTLLNEIVPRLQAGLTDPQDFYYTFYKPTHLYATDAYRTYFVDKMRGITMFKYSVPKTQEEEADMNRFFDEQNVVEQDRAVMWEFWKKGYGRKEVEEYYRTVVVPRNKQLHEPIGEE